jgi:site-specific DNA recombinase
MSKRAVIYARLSVSREESVSIARQIEKCRKYCEARGWAVVAEYRDDGVSATHNRPERRTGWRALVDSRERYDVVLVWKVDRLARRVLDFLRADESLQQRGAGLVSVEEPIDMTTGQGRAFATMLAVFAELEADAIRSRVAGARTHLLQSGRVVGGTIPFGWRSVANPDGAGLVLAQDPERIEWVRRMVERVLAGSTVYSVTAWLNEVEAPRPTQRATAWRYSSVERLLRHPIVAGMVPFNPGHSKHSRGTEVLRDAAGLPVVDRSIAVLAPSERRRLLALLDGRDNPQSRPRASREATSPMLSGLVSCGVCSTPMHRGSTQGRPSLSCPKCHQTISRNQLDGFILDRLREERGGVEIIEWTLSDSADPHLLEEVEEAVTETTAAMGRDDADVPALLARLANLKDTRAELRSVPADHHWHGTGRSVSEALDEAQDDLARRDVLAGQVQSISIVRGKTGRYLDPARVIIEWADHARTLPDGTVLVHKVERGPLGEGRIGGVLLNAGRTKFYRPPQ